MDHVILKGRKEDRESAGKSRRRVLSKQAPQRSGAIVGSNLGNGFGRMREMQDTSVARSSTQWAVVSDDPIVALQEISGP